MSLKHLFTTQTELSISWICETLIPLPHGVKLQSPLAQGMQIHQAR